MKAAWFSVWVLASSPKENFLFGDLGMYLGFQWKLKWHKNSVNNILLLTLEKSSVCLESYQIAMK